MNNSRQGKTALHLPCPVILKSEATAPVYVLETDIHTEIYAQ